MTDNGYRTWASTAGGGRPALRAVHQDAPARVLSRGEGEEDLRTGDQRGHPAHLRRHRRAIRRRPSTDAASWTSSPGPSPRNWPSAELFHFKEDKSQDSPPTFWAVRTHGYKYVVTEPTGDFGSTTSARIRTRCRASRAGRSTRRSSPRWQGGLRRCERLRPRGAPSANLDRPPLSAHQVPGAVHVPFERARIGLPVPAGRANAVGELHVAEDGTGPRTGGTSSPCALSMRPATPTTRRLGSPFTLR